MALKPIRRLCTLFAGFVSTSALATNSSINLTTGVTPISRDIYNLHMTIFWICVAIGVVVFGVMFYALWKHRKSKGHQAAQFHGSTKLEIVWTIIPFLILVVMAIPATIVLKRMSDDSHADVNIKIVGHQWKWQYEYLDEGISYFSNLSTPQDQLNDKQPKNKWYLLEVDKPLVVPIHQKIRFLVTSNDVIHAWWVPALGVKRDAIPGFIHEAWAKIEKPGVYRGQCAELCGINHAFMPIVIEAKTEAGYKKWLAEQKQKMGITTAVTATAQTTPSTTPKKMSKQALMEQGKKIYDTSCAVCHKPGGEGMPPAFPALKGGKITTGPVKQHIDIVLHGKKGTAMQAFKNQLSDVDIAAVVTYERNAWGNADTKKYGKHAGGIVQPSDVAKEKAKG